MTSQWGLMMFGGQKIYKSFVLFRFMVKEPYYFSCFNKLEWKACSHHCLWFVIWFIFFLRKYHGWKEPRLRVVPVAIPFVTVPCCNSSFIHTTQWHVMTRWWGNWQWSNKASMERGPVRFSIQCEIHNKARERENIQLLNSHGSADNAGKRSLSKCWKCGFHLVMSGVVCWFHRRPL